VQLVGVSLAFDVRSECGWFASPFASADGVLDGPAGLEGDEAGIAANRVVLLAEDRIKPGALLVGEVKHIVNDRAETALRESLRQSLDTTMLAPNILQGRLETP
jgi:hypothetical protein